MCRVILIVLMMSFSVGNSYAQEVPPSVTKYIKDPVLVGSGRLSKWLWDAYDASLYSSSGKFSPNEPFALSLDYLMDFSKEQIAERSIKEIRKQGFKDKDKLGKWYYKLVDIFIDVDEGINITGIYFSDGSAGFYSGKKALGYIDDKELARLFFDIWLSPKTSEPDMRKQLLGIK